MFFARFLHVKPYSILSRFAVRRKILTLTIINHKSCYHQQRFGSTNIQAIQERFDLRKNSKPTISSNNIGLEEEESDSDSIPSDENPCGTSSSTADDFAQFELSLNEEDRKKFKQIKYEYELWKFADSTIPEDLQTKDWSEMLGLQSAQERLNYLTKLYRKRRLYRKSKEDLKKAAIKRQELREMRIRENPDHLIYQMGFNTFFRRLAHKQYNKTYNFRLFYSFLNGPHIVYDLSYLKFLAKKEQSLTLVQILRTISANRCHRTPANLILSDFDETEAWYKLWQSQLLAYTSIDEYPITVTHRRYCDIFPKEKIVYLSPDADKCLTSVDTDKVYIVGACVDKLKMKPKASLEKAKADGVQCMKLPLDYYIKWEKGHKYLCLDHVLHILLDMSTTNDWYTVLHKHIPNRKFTPSTEQDVQISRMRNQNIRERNSFLLGIVGDSD